MKSIYERVLNLRNRISLDGNNTIYDEDYLLLDEVLDYLESIEQRAQEELYNNTVDIYNELKTGIKKKKESEIVIFGDLFIRFENTLVLRKRRKKMEEQIKKLQEELEIVKKERDNLILEKKKTFIKTRLNNSITYCRRLPVKKALIINRNYIEALHRYETRALQPLIDDYGYDLVVECMNELFLKEKENE